MALEVSGAAWAWCPWMLLQISSPLPPNKLKDGRSLDLDLGGSAGSFSASLVLRASSAASSLPAGRGVEGRRVVGFSGSALDEHVEVPEGAPPWSTHASCFAASANPTTVALGGHRSLPCIGLEEEFLNKGFMSASSAPPLPIMVEWRPSSSSTSCWRPFPELGAGSSHLLTAKWFVPGGGLQVTGF
jgi:hypothetical protein